MVGPESQSAVDIVSEYDSEYDTEEESDEEESEEEDHELLTGMTDREAEEGSSSSDEDDEEINLDSEFKAFVENFGHLDFHLLNFLPKIKTKSQLLDYRQKLQDERRFNRSDHIAAKNCERMARFQANSELGAIQEELEEEQYGSETDNTRQHRSSKK